MPMTEKQLLARDAKRDLGAELLLSARQMMAGKGKGKVSTPARQTEDAKIALAFREACAHAKKNLAMHGYKLPTQDWTGGEIRNPAV